MARRDSNRDNSCTHRKSGLNGWDAYVDPKDSMDCVIGMIITERDEQWARSWVQGDHVVDLRVPSLIH